MFEYLDPGNLVTSPPFLYLLLIIMLLRLNPHLRFLRLLFLLPPLSFTLYYVASVSLSFQYASSFRLHLYLLSPPFLTLPLICVRLSLLFLCSILLPESPSHLGLSV